MWWCIIYNVLILFKLVLASRSTCFWEWLPHSALQFWLQVFKIKAQKQPQTTPGVTVVYIYEYIIIKL